MRPVTWRIDAVPVQLLPTFRSSSILALYESGTPGWPTREVCLLPGDEGPSQSGTLRSGMVRAVAVAGLYRTGPCPYVPSTDYPYVVPILAIVFYSCSVFAVVAYHPP